MQIFVPALLLHIRAYLKAWLVETDATEYSVKENKAEEQEV